MNTISHDEWFMNTPLVSASLLDEAEQRYADLIAKLREQAKEWEDDRPSYRQDSGYTDGKNICGEVLTDILDEEKGS
jgi:hypothetical protein